MELNTLHKGLSYEQYDTFGKSVKALRASHLGYLRKSPAHLKVALETPQKETEALRFGKLFHKAMENPRRFMDTFVIMPEFEGKTKDGKPTKSKNSIEVKQARQDWINSQEPDAVIVDQEEADLITGMIKSVSQHKIAAFILAKGTPEVSGWVEDPATGVILQFRPDYIHEMGYIIDLKTTIDASEESFTSDIFSRRGRFYLLQAAHYAYCAKLIGMKGYDSFTFVAVEKSAPYGVNVFTLSEAHLDAAEELRSALTKRYAQCLASDEWPGYSNLAINPLIPQYL